MADDGNLRRTLDVIRRKRRYVFSRYLPDPSDGCRPEDIRHVLVIISASRSGSSLLYHQLSGHPRMLAPHGEEIVFYKLAGLGLIGDPGDSHFIAGDVALPAAARAALARDILSDSGYAFGAGERRDFPLERYLVDSVQRLLPQWPESDFDCDDLYRTARRTLEGHLRADRPFDAGHYWLDLLSALIAQGHALNPYFYDLPRDAVRRRHPALPRVEGPPCSAVCLEEPPFIVPRPRAFAPPAGGVDGCLLLKSSSNCYRIEFMKGLYPNARFSFLYLTRNPAAAINGLMDGWLSSGFYSHNVAGLAVLDIAGYSTPQRPWSRQWWNFDSPPGWAGYVDAPLESVCAFQWGSANRHVIAGIGSGAIGRYLIVRYEDLLNPQTLPRELARAFDFAGLESRAVLDDFRAPAAVMAVNPPGPRKWMKRREVILPALRDEMVASVARSLDYDVNLAEAFV